LSKGQFQFDLWEVQAKRYDWNDLREKVAQHGVRNSLLLAPMPTASTSQILGNNECFEPITSNIYTRRTLAGDFVLINSYLVKELLALGQWNVQVKDSIIANHGSVQHLPISDHLKQKYKIVWEMPMKHLIDMAVERGAFICQSQSLNLWIKDPTYTILTSMYFYGWKKGLKTGIYYLRRKPKQDFMPTKRKLKLRVGQQLRPSMRS
jgi:ribonucleotide reductase alpha subunit